MLLFLIFLLLAPIIIHINELSPDLRLLIDAVIFMALMGWIIRYIIQTKRYIKGFLFVSIVVIDLFFTAVIMIVELPNRVSVEGEYEITLQCKMECTQPNAMETNPIYRYKVFLSMGKVHLGYLSDAYLTLDKPKEFLKTIGSSR